MVTKPQYGKILVSEIFYNRADAEEFAKEMKTEYKQADISIKHDIVRTTDSRWKAIIYQKVS